MSILPTWPIAAGALAVGICLGAGADHLYMSGKVSARDKTIAQMKAATAEELRVREVKRAADERNARSIEQQMAERIGLAEQEKADEIARIRADSARTIAGLQSRPDRKPAPTSGSAPATPACTGATGAELSRTDAVFLDGESTRADEHRAALATCYKWADAVEGKSPK